MGDEYDFHEILKRLENLSDDEDLGSGSSMGIPISPIQNSKSSKNSSSNSFNSSVYMDKTIFTELNTRYNLNLQTKDDLLNEFERITRENSAKEYSEKQYQTEKDELVSKIRKYKDLNYQQSHELEDKLDIIQKLNREIEQYKENENIKDIQIQKLKENQKSLRNELELSQQQIKNLKSSVENNVENVFNAMQSNFTSSSEKLSQLTEQRNNLTLLVYKQKALIDRLTSLQTKSPNKSVESKPNSDNCQLDFILNVIEDNSIQYGSSHVRTKIESISNNKEIPVKDKINTIISYLITKENEEQTERIKFLECKLANLVSVLDQESALLMKIASDEKISEIVFPSEKQTIPTEFREKLIREATLLSAYIDKTLPITFKALSEIQKLQFSAFGDEKDISSIVETAYKLHASRKDDAQSLFYLFTSQLAASSMLRRFATDRDARVTFLQRENSKLKRSLDEYNAAIKENKEYKEKENQMLELLRSVFEIHSETNVLTILEAAINAFRRAFSEGERAKKLRLSLEKMKTEFTQKMFEVQEKYKEEIEKMEVERVKYEMESATSMKNLELENKKLSEKNEKMRKTVDELKLNLQNIIEKSEKVQKICEDQKRTIDEQTKNHEKQLEDLGLQLKDAIEKQKEATISSKRYKDDNNKLKQKVIELDQANEKSHAILREAARAARDEGDCIRREMNKQIEIAKSEAKDYKEKLENAINEKNAIFIEMKSLSLELQSVRQQRDAAVSRAKTADELLKDKMENYELKEKVVNFINSYSQHSETELNVLSDEDIVKSLDFIEDEIINNEDHQIVANCMKFLSVEDKFDVEDRVSEIVEQNSYIESQIKTLKGEIDSIRAIKEKNSDQWEKWGRKLLFNQDSEKLLSGEQIRQFLEEEILSSRMPLSQKENVSVKRPLIPVY
ncbi:hypothetical protein TVAG_143460 [Trichomonas vaginalis G3]|uniref:Uncharacterized protein n=1 Tax=Trichomonas vaginalis (strain ATCC PRA-98 / G3) TaxID=412133 RepID=A2EWE2_TRIV3|nr:hypothetical protein TVAGG3_0353590 [Trichomonas vaginalis G3]EAY03046.1 hypothetical protein TVAG_143460 [Trichomonas vaginalis G3]KAI5531470.1 hypothetical protein TVAGG3_0353590 [Trichomonas vaginalis G3]|eukprot:XP_001315269.1 hypothetical protein [Trichomonas vaginalis G3]